MAKTTWTQRKYKPYILVHVLPESQTTFQSRNLITQSKDFGQSENLMVAAGFLPSKLGDKSGAAFC